LLVDVAGASDGVVFDVDSEDVSAVDELVSEEVSDVESEFSVTELDADDVDSRLVSSAFVALVSPACSVVALSSLADASLAFFFDSLTFSRDSLTFLLEATCARVGPPLCVFVVTLTTAFPALNARIIDTNATGVTKGGVR
jgi:hypothetical protein